MKNVSVVLNIVLAVVVAFSLVSCNGGGSGPASSTDEGGNTKTASVNTIKDIAYVQMDSLFNSYDMYHDLRVEYEKKVKQMDADFTAKGRTFQKQVEDFEEKVSKGLVTRSQAEQMQADLQRKQADLEQTRQRMGADLAEQDMVLQRQISEAITKYIKKYNEEKNYALILNNATILHADQSMDITADIIKGLNEEYIANRGKQTSTTTTPNE